MKKKMKTFLCLFLAVILMCPGNLIAVKAGEADQVLILKPSITEDSRNYFRYTAGTAATWFPGDSEAYIDLGAQNAEASQYFYEIQFYGNAIEVFANKAANHGKVQFSVDGGAVTEADLYNAQRTEPLSVYKAEKLTEGAHTLKAVTMSEKSGSSIVNQVAYAQITHQPYTGGKPDLGGIIADTNTQYTQKRYSEVLGKESIPAEYYAWKNDTVCSQIVLYSMECSLDNVTLSVSDLVSDQGTISKENVTAAFVKSTLAYNNGRTWWELPDATPSNRSESADILYQTTPVDIPWNSLQPVWVEYKIPADAATGTYTATITATADGIEEPLTFTSKIHVVRATLADASEFEKSFDIELWQYPYTSAEYYNVTPFSDKHLEIMKSTMLKYKEIGGHAITASIVEDAWNGQTYSKNEVHYPSMVKWTKNRDGSFQYDYTELDQWISFNKSLGIGDKIVLYSIAPWHDSFTYWENGTLKKEAFTVGSERYTSVWTDFLQNLIDHVTEKGWFENCYIGIDELRFSDEAFDQIESVTNKNGEHFKTAGAMDSFVEKTNLAMRVTDLNVGDTAAASSPTDFQKLLEKRTAAGLRTTLYSCTGHAPGNFSLSQPMESYWTIINAGKMGTAGFLRWALDAWVEDPLKDTTHSLFEAGDCFLIFPDEKDAQNPVSKSSIRLEQMAAGVRDMNKINQMRQEAPELSEEIDALFNTITMTPYGSNNTLSEAQIESLAGQIDAFHEGLNQLSEKYAVKNAQEALDQTINDAEKMTDASAYSKESWQAFQNALETAKKLKEKGDVSSEEYEAAILKVKDTMKKLQPPVVEKPQETEEKTETPDTSGNQPQEKDVPKKGETYPCAGGYYKVTDDSEKTAAVTFVKPEKKTMKKLVLPSTVTIKGKTFKVTAIADNACKNQKKLASVVIGKNIKTIGKSAFQGAKNLKSIVFKTTTLKKVGANALKGIHKNCKIKTGKKCLKKYQKLLKKKGQKATVRIVK